MRNFKFHYLILTLVLPAIAEGQFKSIIENYLNKQPVTTSFDSVRSEVDILENFLPQDNSFLPLSALPRNSEGSYILNKGLYSLHAKSFCLRAGTYGPGKGDGYLYANLAGPQAYLIQNILENWQLKHPKIPQTEIQKIIWAIIAKTNVKKMNIVHKAILLELLDMQDLAKLAENSLTTEAIDKLWGMVKNKIPPLFYNIVEAERNLRGLYERADATYEQFEHYAVLAGIAPESDRIREVTKGRWSYHPNGYFIRYFPNGYRETKVDIYVPRNIKAENDNKGRIGKIYSDSSFKIYLNYDVNNALKSFKFSLPKGFDTTVMLKRNLLIRYNTNVDDFSGESSNNANLLNFFNLLFPKTSDLKIHLKSQDKMQVYNLQSISFAIDSIISGSEDPFLNLSSYLLNEAANNVIYHSLFTESTASPLLDLSSTVAVPANRSHQRLGIANEPNVPSNEDCDISSLPNFDKSNKRYHSYLVKHFICNKKVKGCTISGVFDIMISSANFLAPTDATTPVANCSKNNADIPILGKGEIITYVNSSEHWIINYTLPGHPLYPGYAKRTVIEENGSIYITTFGEGTGSWGALNGWLANWLWGGVDDLIKDFFKNGK